MNNFILHTMTYQGGSVESPLALPTYTESDYPAYKKIYEDCFHEMRLALALTPTDDCDSAEELLQKCNDIFVYQENNTPIGSVAIYQNEIDDLIVAKDYQHQGYGRRLLAFAVAHMQKNGIAPIILNVVAWNSHAVKLYLQNGFTITATRTIEL